MTIEEIKEELLRKGYTIRGISRYMNLAPSVISNVLNGKYSGAKSTENKVIKYVNDLISNKIALEDLNSLIYENIDILYDTMLIAIKSAKLKNEQLDRLIPIYQKFSQLKKAKEQNEK